MTKTSSTPTISPRRFLIVANPATGKKRRLPKILKKLSAALETNQHSFQVHFTQKDHNGSQMVRRYLSPEVTDIVAIGGDGTLNEVINGFDDHRMVFSFIPNGSGNDFAKNFHFSSLDHQVHTVLAGTIHTMDLGECNGRKFINGVGMGLDGQVIYDLLHRNNILSGSQKYYYHVLRNLFGFRGGAMRYRIRDHDCERPLLLLCIGNGTTFGNGFKLTPLADLFDGFLDVCAVGNLSVSRRFFQLVKLAYGTHDDLPEVEFDQAQEIHVTGNAGLHAHIDGEYLGSPPYHIRVLPGKLNIRLPEITRINGFIK